jgi:hypothetical protein
MAFTPYRAALALLLDMLLMALKGRRRCLGYLLSFLLLLLLLLLV